MPITAVTTTVNAAFFQPLHELAAASPHARLCPEFTDDACLRLGVQRVLEASLSGRAFLQEHGPRFENPPGHSNYFATFQSERRLQVLQEVGLALVTTANPTLQDRLADIPELADYECFAADGHWHQAATHDLRHAGAKLAVGHFYSLNLRTHTLRPLATGQGLHEHDMTALKRITPRGLRQGVPQGKRVLRIYDKAGIDLDFWKRCRHEGAVYFLSLVKANLVFDELPSGAWDRADPRNHGVTADRRVLTKGGHILRIVGYTDPRTQTAYEFLTNELDLPPGVIAELYRRRWEIEKVFDQIKNKLHEQKAWGTSLIAKAAQAQWIALTHNLLLLYEQELAAQHGVRNEAEDQRRAKRIHAEEQACAQAGQPLSALVGAARGATQRSVKFIRWLRQSLQDHAAEAVAVLRLQALYSTL